MDSRVLLELDFQLQLGAKIQCTMLRTLFEKMKGNGRREGRGQKTCNMSLGVIL